MTHTNRLARFAAATGAVPLLIVSLALPAAAEPDPGDPVQRSDSVQTDCPLRRIDRQLVRCDYLTGAGIVAPIGVPHI